MKKFLFFLFCIFLLLPGCSNEDYRSGNETKSSTNKVKWYGVNKSTSNTTRGVADEANLWNQKVGISVKFINNPANEGMIEKIKSIAKEWENYADITFHFLGSDQNADVRIAFDWDNNDYLTWSYTGTDAKLVSNQNEPTAVFGGLEYSDEEQFKGDVLRIFGQILGLEYEQRHQDWTFWKSEAQLQSYWMSMFDGLDLDWSQIKQFVFTPLTGENAIFPTQTDQIDELSIMAWPYYSRAQASKLLANFELSEGDKSFIAKLYPKENETLPTIQEAWVDAGYFEWVTKDNWNTHSWEGNDPKSYDWDKYDDGFVEGTVMLRMTELGAQQEYLPDVRDGEQLTCAYRMFSYKAWINPKLKKSPKFNSSNITYFRQMFKDCINLQEVELFDTSKGTNFHGMFFNCTSLTNIPFFDTAKGTNFYQMFYACPKLSEIPKINTSNGIKFDEMFYNCKSLTTIPQINTEKGTSFFLMLSYCSSLKTIPLLNTSNGTNFGGMFSNSISLKEIPLLDTSKGEHFNGMFSECTSLKTVPLLNTSKGVDFASIFSYTNLDKIPFLDTSNGTQFAGMLAGTNYTNIPLFNTSKGTDFSNMFEECGPSTNIPLFNTSKGMAFYDMFKNSSIKTIPLLDTSKGQYFDGMFSGCTLLEYIPNIDTRQANRANEMFLNCKNLQVKPNIDLSKAETYDIYKGTKFE